ncbi:NAD(P)H-dependent D-xylose reductase [Histoplasma ohiense]|nr:NAD(P)H-dependent D-xylose reductase [Histoplasma ohiense (nom. inval.)]
MVLLLPPILRLPTQAFLSSTCKSPGTSRCYFLTPLLRPLLGSMTEHLPRSSSVGPHNEVSLSSLRATMKPVSLGIYASMISALSKTKSTESVPLTGILGSTIP